MKQIVATINMIVWTTIVIRPIDSRSLIVVSILNRFPMKKGIKLATIYLCECLWGCYSLEFLPYFSRLSSIPGFCANSTVKQKQHKLIEIWIRINFSMNYVHLAYLIVEFGWSIIGYCPFQYGWFAIFAC